MNTEWLLARALKYLMDKTSSLVSNNDASVFEKNVKIVIIFNRFHRKLMLTQLPHMYIPNIITAPHWIVHKHCVHGLPKTSNRRRNCSHPYSFWPSPGLCQDYVALFLAFSF